MASKLNYETEVQSFGFGLSVSDLKKLERCKRLSLWQAWLQLAIWLNCLHYMDFSFGNSYSCIKSALWDHHYDSAAIAMISSCALVAPTWIDWSIPSCTRWEFSFSRLHVIDHENVSCYLINLVIIQVWSIEILCTYPSKSVAIIW